ncbi:hypothetical protein GCM10028803_14710 [Larkinella knui]|uniref:Uncharacterized protein n=1 Tax=Larkinella knui TaxID=2025310 RepID=A0A3P1C969_9BACT|nr:hypothetical protein [Larkinella knui]RRB09845.1 hypothetical protein EHT87_30460 [Larkinella knui]
MKKTLRSLLILTFIITSVIIASPASIRGILIAIGSFEIVGISILAWMAASARWVVENHQAVLQSTREVPCP